jgi:hypothetical protein
VYDFPFNAVKQLIDGFVNTDEAKAILYLRVFARIFCVFYKSGKFVYGCYFNGGGGAYLAGYRYRGSFDF